MPKTEMKILDGSSRVDSGNDPAYGANVVLDRGRLSDLVGYHIRRAYSKLFQTFNGVMSELGLAPGQYSILVLLSLNPGIMQSALSDATGLGRSSIVPIIDGFVKKGWVRRSRRRDDRRAYALRLTPKGEEVFRASQPLIKEHEELLVGDLSMQERKVLIGLLERVRGLPED